MNYSKLLRRLRHDDRLWSSNTAISDKVARLIVKCKVKLAPQWERERQEQQERFDNMMLFRWH